MSKVADEIRHEYQDWVKYSSIRSDGVCKVNPFKHNHWMIDYMFPELLLLGEEYLDYLHETDPTRYSRTVVCFWEGFIFFPCFVMPEEDVLRIMAECGIL